MWSFGSDCAACEGVLKLIVDPSNKSDEVSLKKTHSTDSGWKFLFYGVRNKILPRCNGLAQNCPMQHLGTIYATPSVIRPNSSIHVTSVSDYTTYCSPPVLNHYIQEVMSANTSVTTTASGKYNIGSILDGTNYSIWRQEMVSFLQSKGLYKFITDRAQALKDKFQDNVEKLEDVLEGDEKALGFIKCNIQSSFLDVVVTSQTALDAWQKLETFFAGKETYNKIQLLEQLIDGKLIETGNPTNDVQKFIRDKNELVRRLDSIGMKIASDLQVAIMLARLPDSYDTMRRILESQADLDIIKFTAELNRESLRQQTKKRKQPIASAFVAKEETPKKKARFAEHFATLNCDYCGQSRHDAASCWFNPKSAKFRPEKKNQLLKLAAKASKNDNSAARNVERLDG